MAEKQKATIPQAARELRICLGYSQQRMAGELNLSMGAVRNYESGAVGVPEARPLYAYTMAAERYNLPELAAVFRAAMYDVLAVPDSSKGKLIIEPKDDFERILIAAMLASIRGNGAFRQFQKPVFQALVEPCRLLNRKVSLYLDVAIEAYNNEVRRLIASHPEKFFLSKVKEAK
jgi:transcriptional regulator with XRE-family HTH domain